MDLQLHSATRQTSLRRIAAGRTVSAGVARNSRRAVRQALLGVLLLTVVAGCKRAPNPDVWATVNGRPIMKQEVEKYFQNKVSAMPQQPTADEAASLKLDILHGRINEEVMKQRAEKLHLVATDAEVDAQIAKIKAPYTDAQFNEQLKAMLSPL